MLKVFSIEESSGEKLFGITFDSNFTFEKDTAETTRPYAIL